MCRPILYSFLLQGNEIGGLGACQGDSGGPLLLYTGLPDDRYVQIGVVYGAVNFCGDPDFPGIYANLEDPDIFWFIKEAIGMRLYYNQLQMQLTKALFLIPYRRRKETTATKKKAPCNKKTNSNKKTFYNIQTSR